MSERMNDGGKDSEPCAYCGEKGHATADCPVGDIPWDRGYGTSVNGGKVPGDMRLVLEPVQANGFRRGEAIMQEAASTDSGYAALVALVAPMLLVEHRSYMQQDGSYRVTLTVESRP